jgi:hypothetical protein
MRRDWLNTAIARSTTAPVTTTSHEATFERSANVPGLPFACSSSWRVGTNAAVIDPSASRRLKRFGRMKAVVNADMTHPVPNIASASESRSSPRTRETTVSNEMTPMFLRLFDTQTRPA